MPIKIIATIFLILSLCNCSELLNRSQPDSTRKNATALLLLSTQGDGCVSTAANSIGSTTRQEINFSGSNCATSLAAIGFTGENLSAGLTGTSTTSRVASTTSFTPAGEKKINIEATYTLNNASGYLDVIGNASVSGTVATGPAFRIKSSTITLVSSTGIEANMGNGTPPSSPVGVEKTLCLEIHEENGAHMFGWNSTCASVANRSSYEFELDSFTTTHPGSNIGFVLNNAILKKIIVSRGAIGTSGQILEF